MRLLLKGLLIASALLVISQGHGKNCSTNCFNDIKTNFQGGLINNRYIRGHSIRRGQEEVGRRSVESPSFWSREQRVDGR